MINIRKSRERGHFDHGWLNTYHSFSFGGYQDAEHMGFRSLRVINEDVVAPGMGFGMHGHSDMEIVTCVLGGALEHKDNLGNGEVLRPGEMQRMSAGTGIEHSEFNPSETEPVHLYQIWLRPAQRGLPPSYEQKAFPSDARVNSLQLVASPTAANGSLMIHQDAQIFLASLQKGNSISHDIAPGRGAWLQVLRGDIELVGQKLKAGDGAAIEGEIKIQFAAEDDAEILLFDMA